MIEKSQEWWNMHYQTYLQSGLTISEYSTNNSLNKHTFRGWIGKLKNSTLQTPTLHRIHVLNSHKTYKIDYLQC